MFHDAIFSTLTQLQNQKNSSHYFNITWRQGIILSAIIEIYTPDTILEIGTGNGFSTLWMKKATPESTITTIEIDSNTYFEAQKNFSKAKVEDSIISINEDVFSSVVHLKDSFECVFIDACQKRYEELVSLLFSTLSFKTNHFFIIDNVESHDKTQTLTKVFEERGYETTIINEGSGFLIATYFE